VAIVFGAVLALVGILGLVAFDRLADLTALNTADSFLQPVLTVVFPGVGFAMGDGDT
jgi:multisubunit Na+/H+ antiporter MnhG subunit